MMSEDNKVSTYQFVAEPFHVDFTEKLTMGVLGNHLLNCAGFHAAERGFGIATLNENHYTWVLSRLAVEMEEMPRAYEKFSIQTWVENVYRLFTDRNFAILPSLRPAPPALHTYGFRACASPVIPTLPAPLDFSRIVLLFCFFFFAFFQSPSS